MTPTIFFDLDGTLTDPAPGITASIEYAARKLGVEQVERPEQYIGPPLRSSFRCILATMDESLVEDAMTHYRERFGLVGLFENEVYEGIPEMLAELTERGHRLRVVTSKPTFYADKIIDHFDLRRFFPRVYGAEMDGTRSDKGELIAHVLSSEGIDGSAATMIGDRKHDILGAKKHRLRTVGVTWGYGAEGEIEEAGADHVVDTVEELGTVLRAA